MSLQDAFGDELSNDVSAVASSSGSGSSSRSLHFDGTHSEDDDATPSSGRNVSGPHVIILQHGFKGTAYDMRLLRNCISALFPENTHVSHLRLTNYLFTSVRLCLISMLSIMKIYTCIYNIICIRIMQVYSAETNELKSDDSIEAMGNRLAVEVHGLLKSEPVRLFFQYYSYY